MSKEDVMGNDKKIVVEKHGRYFVRGHVPLVRKAQVVSEHGEPLTWQKGESLETGETYALCRCGQSDERPFCDGTHYTADFDGTETADTRATAERQEVYPGGTHIVVKHDDYLCMGAGFCANRVTNIERMVTVTADTGIRSQAIAMIERCPSGSLTYALEAEGPDIEPDLPQQVAVVTEITSAGPIAGPLWVTGNIPIERADGEPFETRNRVTLCCCGQSKNKPLCDGTHRPPDIGATGRLQAEP
jgi:CDGSH-type Zn-finger protein